MKLSFGLLPPRAAVLKETCPARPPSACGATWNDRSRASVNAAHRANSWRAAAGACARARVPVADSVAAIDGTREATAVMSDNWVPHARGARRGLSRCIASAALMTWASCVGEAPPGMTSRPEARGKAGALATSSAKPEVAPSRRTKHLTLLNYSPADDRDAEDEDAVLGRESVPPSPSSTVIPLPDNVALESAPQAASGAWDAGGEGPRRSDAGARSTGERDAGQPGAEDLDSGVPEAGSPAAGFGAVAPDSAAPETHDVDGGRRTPRGLTAREAAGDGGVGAEEFPPGGEFVVGPRDAGVPWPEVSTAAPAAVEAVDGGSAGSTSAVVDERASLGQGWTNPLRPEGTVRGTIVHVSAGLISFADGARPRQIHGTPLEFFGLSEGDAVEISYRQIGRNAWGWPPASDVTRPPIATYAVRGSIRGPAARLDRESGRLQIGALKLRSHPATLEGVGLGQVLHVEFIHVLGELWAYSVKFADP